jgi:hypothetical protein
MQSRCLGWCAVIAAVLAVVLCTPAIAATPSPGPDDKGRFFVFLDPEFANFRYKEVNAERIVTDIVESGGTDIIVIDSQKGTVVWDSDVPGVLKDPNLREKRSSRFFEKIVDLAAAKHLNVWVGLPVT